MPSYNEIIQDVAEEIYLTFYRSNQPDNVTWMSEYVQDVANAASMPVEDVHQHIASVIIELSHSSSHGDLTKPVTYH